MSFNDIYNIINNLSLENEELIELCSYFYNNPDKISYVMNFLNKFSTPDHKVEFLERAILTTTADEYQGSSIRKRRKSWKTYIASDGNSVELPQQIIDILRSDKFTPESRDTFTEKLRNIQAGDIIEMPYLGQMPKHFAQGYQGNKFFITSQMIEIWETFSKDQPNSIKRVLSGPMGVGKSYIAFFLAAKAFAERWLMLYIADAAKLDLFSNEETSKVIVKYFLAVNKDILTATELEELVEGIRTDDYAVPFVGAIWNMFNQRSRKTLMVVDEHGVLFSCEPAVPHRLITLKPLMNLTYWSEDSLGARVVLTGTAHAMFEKKYLINGMHDWIEFVVPLPEIIFDSLLTLHPVLGLERIASKVKEVTNCVPRELIYLDKHVKSLANNSYIPDDDYDKLLKRFRDDRHSELLNIARNHFNALEIGSKIDYRKNLSIMFLKSSRVESGASFDWKFLDTGLVYRFKDEYNFVLFRPLCPAASDALLDVYRTFPLPRDVSLTSLKDGRLTGESFEEILFQQMLNHRKLLFKATNLAGCPITDVDIQFEHFIALERNKLAPGPQHAKSLVRGYADYPRFDFMIGRTFIQVSISSFDQHNKDSANITKAFERFYKDGDDTRNQIEIYLDIMFGGRHTASLKKGRFEVFKDNVLVPDFRIVYMRGSPGTPKHTKLVNKYLDLAFINYEEIKDKLFGDFLKI